MLIRLGFKLDTILGRQYYAEPAVQIHRKIVDFLRVHIVLYIITLL